MSQINQIKPLVFKVTGNEPPKLSLEAASPDVPTESTLLVSLDDTEYEALQLELDLFPLRDGEEVCYSTGAHIRIIPLQGAAPKECQVTFSSGKTLSQDKIKTLKEYK